MQIYTNKTMMIKQIIVQLLSYLLNSLNYLQNKFYFHKNIFIQFHFIILEIISQLSHGLIIQLNQFTHEVRIALRRTS